MHDRYDPRVLSRESDAMYSRNATQPIMHVPQLRSAVDCETHPVGDVLDSLSTRVNDLSHEIENMEKRLTAVLTPLHPAPVDDCLGTGSPTCSAAGIAPRGQHPEPVRQDRRPVRRHPADDRTRRALRSVHKLCLLME
jgi:hypothetical protein